jgi:hypothetical protein
MLPHRPPPPVPGEKRLNLIENKQTAVHRKHSLENSQTTENVYLTVKEIPRSIIKEEDEDDETSQSKPTETEKNLSTPLEDKVK